MSVYKVLYFPGVMKEGGVENLIMNYLRKIDRTKIQIDFCVSRTYPAPLDEEIKRYGCRIIYISTIKEKKWRYISYITDIINEYGPYDAVHIHSAHMGAFSLLASRKAGINKRVYHVHSSQNLALRKIPFRNIIERILSKIITSNATHRLACSIPAGNFVYRSFPFICLKNAIDLNLFYPYDPIDIERIKNSLLIPKDAIVVGNVARFVPGKNQEHIVRIIAEDKKNNGNLFGLFVGDGNTLDNVKEYAVCHGCIDKLIFVGAQTNTAMYYNLMDVFCMPSEFEGLPLVTVEAQACGIPCVISDGVPDDVKMGDLLVYKCKLSDSLITWTDQIYSLVNKRQFSKAYVHSQIIQSGYDLDNVISQLESIYLD